MLLEGNITKGQILAQLIKKSFLPFGEYLDPLVQTTLFLTKISKRMSAKMFLLLFLSFDRKNQNKKMVPICFFPNLTKEENTSPVLVIAKIQQAFFILMKCRPKGLEAMNK